MRFSPRLLLPAALGGTALVALAAHLLGPGSLPRERLAAAPAAGVTSNSAAAPSLIPTAGPPEASWPAHAAAGGFPAAELPFARFRSWADAGLPSDGGTASLEHGIELAKARRRAMAGLIATDPARALAEAVPPAARRKLPPEIVALLEEPVSARGTFRVVATLPDVPGRTTALRREFAVPGGPTYQARVFGARLRQPSAENLALQGIALDGQLAVAESPVRILAKGEAIPAGKPVVDTCPVSGVTVPGARSGVVAADNLAAEIGGTIHFFCGAGHLADLERAARSGLAGGADGNGPIANSAYTQGTKRILLLRVKFIDDPTEPMSLAEGQNILAAVDAFIAENSYGTTRIDVANSVVTPVLTMTKTKAEYQAMGVPYYFLDDARAVAAAAGYNYLDYDFEWLRYVPIYGFSGQAYIGMRGAWLQTSDPGVACHEWGHNLGLLHANLWAASGDTVIGAGYHVEYGDSFDNMGTAGLGNNSFNACHRWLLGWLPNGNVQTVTASGTYRVHAFDRATLAAGQPLALRTAKDATRFYWLEHRAQWGFNPSVTNGVLLHWSPWSGSNGGTHLLDVTAGTPEGNGDAALVIGRTFSDFAAGVHLTPVAHNPSTNPPSVDVVVNRGAFPGNRPPVLSLSASAISVAENASVSFTAAATDPDGDALAYFWDFGNGAVSPNAAVASASWPAAGVYAVRCVVSDMKGGASARSVLVLVGTPTAFLAAGRVLDNYGQPVAGARVHNGLSGSSYRSASTDDDGNYFLANLPAGSYTLSAASGTFVGGATAGFENPIVVGPSRAGLDFTGTLAGPIVTVTRPAQPPREAGQIPADFVFARGRQTPATNTLTVAFTLSGTADRAADYVVSAVPPATGSYDPSNGAGTLTFPSGATTALLRLTPVDDALPEGAENVIATLAEGAGYQLPDMPAAATTIVDNDAADVYTETFSAGATTLRPFDLDGRRLSFTPTSAGAYVGACDPAASFAVDSASGTMLAAGGAATTALALGSLSGGSWQLTGLEVAPVIFGQTFSTIYVNTNGNVTFEGGDFRNVGSPPVHFTGGLRRVSLFLTGLDLTKGGNVSWRVVAGPPRVVVTYANVPVAGVGAGVLNAQVELGADGKIAITYLGTTAGDGMIGLAGGQTEPYSYNQTDLSAYAPSFTGFNAWLAGRFSSAELNDPNVGGFGADPDSDGWSNLLEYALGSDPRSAGRPPGAPLAGRSGNYLTLSFRRDSALTDLIYAVEATDDLRGAWTEVARSAGGGATVASPGQSPSSLNETAVGNGTLDVTVGDVIPSGPGAPRRFLRLRVLRP